MAQIDLPGDIAVDVRMPIVGNSFTWEGTEPAANKKKFCIHATGVNAPAQDGFTMADFHVNHNGWGGIGVHFVCTQDDYPGRPGVTPAGAHVQYVGDLNSWRAGVLNNNPGVIHLEIAGLFTPGNGVPSEAQLRAVRKVIDYLMSPNGVMPSLSFYNQVVYHNQIAVQPEGATACPGWQHPQFNEWISYLRGGSEPSWFASQQPAPAPQPVPAPVSTPDPQPVDNRPEWERSWTEHALPDKVVAAPTTDVFDFVANKAVATLHLGDPVKQLVGVFTVGGVLYGRTQWSVDNSRWNGVKVSDLLDATPTPPADPGQGGVTVPVATPETPNPGNSSPVASSDGPVIDGVVPPAPTSTVTPLPVSVPNQAVPTLHWSDFWEALIGFFLSPLRILGLFKKK
jgi:hypothetical protein